MDSCLLQVADDLRFGKPLLHVRRLLRNGFYQDPAGTEIAGQVAAAGILLVIVLSGEIIRRIRGSNHAAIISSRNPVSRCAIRAGGCR
jgi:hypothetical protein